MRKLKESSFGIIECLPTFHYLQNLLLFIKYALSKCLEDHSLASRMKMVGMQERHYDRLWQPEAHMHHTLFTDASTDNVPLSLQKMNHNLVTLQ